MSTEPSPSNPFRRRGSSNAPPSQLSPAPAAPVVPIIHTKPIKKVRVQSPPPLSPDDPRTLPAPSPPSSDEEPAVSYFGAPPNPFQRTLETLEQRGPREHEPHPGRASMDVEAFKRLLLTGSADGSANTSLSSRQSLFDAAPEPLQESPRTSHEVSDADAERAALGTARKPPPPPSSRHGKAIKTQSPEIQEPLSPSRGVEVQSPSKAFERASPRLSDLPSLSRPSDLPSLSRPSDLSSPSRPSDLSSPSRPSDLPSPSRLSDLPSPLSADLPSPSQKKIAPLPPLTKRHSHHLPARTETPDSFPESEARPRSSSFRAPPPPPSRRPASVIFSSPKTGSIAPPPPPTRSASVRKPNRPASITSVDSTTSKRSGALPPPPPPRQRASSGNGSENTTHANDILASLNALQRDLDDYRNQVGHRKLSETFSDSAHG